MNKAASTLANEAHLANKAGEVKLAEALALAAKAVTQVRKDRVDD